MAEVSNARAAPAAEPAMEDILASIRRILNDDAPGADAVAAPAPLAEARAESPPLADDVLVLDESMLARPANDHLPATPPHIADDMAADDLAEESVTMADIDPIEHDQPDSLLAPHASSVAKAALAGLMQRLDSARETKVYRGGPTIEDLVREEIRPILKTWLDEQLPEMVERIVRVEIERLTSHLR